MAYTVKRIAEIAGVSVRTLHHYDEIGLLKPSSHSAAGYRLYQEKDLERLQQVLFFKELGFDLKEIKRILADPDFDRHSALVEHRKLLLERQERFGRLIQSVDRTLVAMQRGHAMNAKMFDGFDAAQYEEEARERWGGTPEWDESRRRFKGYGPAEMAQIQRDGEAVLEGLVARMDRSPDDAEVQDLIDKHYRMMNKWFFNCSIEIYRQLAEGYANDPKFAAFWNRIKPGLEHFIRNAMRVYCDAYEQRQKP